MTLDFDVDDEPSFQQLVQSGREDVLKGRTMAQCWADLADQHVFFKDIAREGRLRGENLGVVLAAAEGISRVVQRTEQANMPPGVTAEKALTSSSFPSSNANATPGTVPAEDDELCNANVLVRVTSAFLCLYSSTPVPTRAQWLRSMRAATAELAAATTDVADDRNADASSPAATSNITCASSTVGRFVRKLHMSLQSMAQERNGGRDGGDDEDAEGEDGSFAEEQFKELMRCCIVAGRRAARHSVLSKSEAKAVREMVKALQDFMGSSTLKW